MIHEKSADTKVLESVLKEAKVGDTITYQQLSKAIGRDVRQFATGSLQSARRFILKEHRMVFGVEANVGLVRLDDAGILRSTESDRLCIHRRSKRTLDKLAVVKFDGLSAEAKKQHTATAAILGAVAMFSHKTSTNKIESRIDESKQTLAIGETLKMFS